MQDAVADIGLSLKELAAEDRAGWSLLGLSDRLRDVAGINETAQVELIRTLAGWDRRVAWGEDGAVTAVSWLKAHLDMPQGEAAGLVHLARFYAEHRPVADALDGGLITVAKARLLLRASRRREELFAACVEGLTELAGELSLEDFSGVLAEWVDVVDDQAPHDDSKRRLSSSDVGDQGITEIVGSPEDAAIIRAAIEAHDTLDPADAPEGPRSREQRHHDTAIDIFRRALTDKLGQDPMTVSGVDVIVDAETAAEVTAEEPPSTEERLQPFKDADTDTIQRRKAEHPDGRRATRAFVAALLCSGFVRRIIIDPQTGATLDVGRAQRRFTRRQYRALVIRDGGCVFPGCDRNAKWCDAHHLKPWEDHGPTDLDNGCLLCRRHHILIHHSGWTLQRDKRTGMFTATSPDGRQFTRRPRSRC